MILPFLFMHPKIRVGEWVKGISIIASLLILIFLSLVSIRKSSDIKKKKKQEEEEERKKESKYKKEIKIVYHYTI